MSDFKQIDLINKHKTRQLNGRIQTTESVFTIPCKVNSVSGNKFSNFISQDIKLAYSIVINEWYYDENMDEIRFNGRSFKIEKVTSIGNMELLLDVSELP